MDPEYMNFDRCNRNWMAGPNLNWPTRENLPSGHPRILTNRKRRMPKRGKNPSGTWQPGPSRNEILNPYVTPSLGGSSGNSSDLSSADPVGETKEEKAKRLENLKLEMSIQKKMDWLFAKDRVPEHMEDNMYPCEEINSIADLWTDKEFSIILEHHKKDPDNFNLAFKEMYQKGSRKSVEKAREVMTKLNDPKYRVYTQEKVNDIRELVHEEGKDWRTIGRHVELPPYRVQALYQSLPKHEQCKPYWSKPEVQLLLRQRQKHGDKYFEIGEEIPGRSIEACHKFIEAVKQKQVEKVKKTTEIEMKRRKAKGLPIPGEHREPWSEEERALLVIAAIAHDGNFNAVKNSDFKERSANELYEAFYEEIGFKKHFDFRYGRHAHYYDIPGAE